MTQTSFKVGALTLRAKRMDARTQLHVVRRFGSFAKNIGTFKAAFDAAKSGQATDDILSVVGPLGDVLASLPDDQVNYIMDAALNAAEVKQDGVQEFAPLRTGGVTMFQIDAVQELIIVAQVLKANLAGFMAVLPALGIRPETPQP
jgi:hypothetical protein